MQFKVTLPEPPDGATKHTLKVGWLQQSVSKELAAKDRTATIDVPEVAPDFALVLSYGPDTGQVRQAFKMDGTPKGKGPIAVKAGKTAEAKVEASVDAGK